MRTLAVETGTPSTTFGTIAKGLRCLDSGGAEYSLWRLLNHHRISHSAISVDNELEQYVSLAPPSLCVARIHRRNLYQWQIAAFVNRRLFGDQCKSVQVSLSLRLIPIYTEVMVNERDQNQGFDAIGVVGSAENVIGILETFEAGWNAPSVRFSRMVRFGNSMRPSGTCTMPRATRSWGGRSRIEAPS